MMVQRIKKLQFLCGVLLLLQIICFKWIIPFHFFAVLLSLIIIINQKFFKVIQLQYHFYLICLYFFRLWLISIGNLYILELIYVTLCLYISIMLILFSFHCIL